MRTFRTPPTFRRWRNARSGNVVLVPTMGALHSGHAALVRRARRLAGKDGAVVVSIFVNPTQFGPDEDFSSYPRPLKSDLSICQKSGADAVFLPSPATLYFDDRSLIVDETTLSQTLCGRSRPGHFRGVCTVVAKLFLITQPTISVFGEKDWQQLAILRRMVRDLDFPIHVVGHPTVRERDGLATSSRNTYLTNEERAVAPGIFRALTKAANATRLSDVLKIAKSGIAKIPGARIDYVEAVDAKTLAPLRNRSVPGRLAAAVYLGRARLIDNIALPPTR
ncbi:MAG: pantoate--beta-alanine ligase [Terrimicrobiaceae bacterium]